MSRSFLSVTALCAMLVASTALAQGGGGRGGMRGMAGLSNLSSMMLVQNAAVQKELDVSDKQKADLQDAMSNMLGNTIGSALQSMFNGGDGTDINQTIGDMTKKADEAVAKILRKEQLARLKELQLQVQGANALISAEVVTKLKVTDEQKTKIQQAIRDGQQQSRGAINAFDPDQTPEERQAAMKAMQEKSQAQQAETMKNALAVLSDDQLVQWAEMTGKEFKFPANMLGGMGGMMGGLGGRGNRGGGNFGGPGGGGN
jgi:hypothetical protein